MYARINPVIKEKLPTYLAKEAKARGDRKITQADIYSKIVPQIVREMFQSKHRAEYASKTFRLRLDQLFEKETEDERRTNTSPNGPGSDGYSRKKLRKDRFSKCWWSGFKKTQLKIKSKEKSKRKSDFAKWLQECLRSI